MIRKHITLEVCGAEGMRLGEPIPVATIKIGTRVVPTYERAQSEVAYAQALDDSARALVDVLRQTLPGGIWDRVLVRMLEAQASLLAVPPAPAWGVLARDFINEVADIEDGAETAGDDYHEVLSSRAKDCAAKARGLL